MARFVVTLSLLIGMDAVCWAQMPAQDLEEQLVSFACDRAEVVWTEQHWQLQAAGKTLKDFGRRENEARQALRLVQALRLNQYGTIGKPSPVLEYWLSDGHAPRGNTAGLRLLSLDPLALKVECGGGQWCLSQNHRVLFKFGRHGEDAQQALAVLKKHGFTQLAVLGQGAPSMLVFLGAENELGATRSPHRTAFRESHVPEGKEKGSGLNSKFGPGVEALTAPEVAPLRGTASPKPGPRHVFASGQLDQLPSGRQLGATPQPPDITKLADRIVLDWKQAQVRRDDSGWVLAAGNYVLARFGAKDYEAQQALHLVQSLHLTDQVAVGQGYFSYYLVNGQPPRGVPLGLEARAFQPDALTVRQVDNRWALCDEREPLLVFGASDGEAKKFLEVIRKERFDRIYRIGVSRAEGFTLLIRGR